ncbi:MAG: hypothetical protein JSU61_09910 [Fidelibacterota bacterium]|nr:MAG: hypothetical protein JSU61_09910 [Candidatus Neomarinimicrobiota bacterium]
MSSTKAMIVDRVVVIFNGEASGLFLEILSATNHFAAFPPLTEQGKMSIHPLYWR